MAHGFFPTCYCMCLNLNIFRVGKLLPSSTTPYCLAIWASLVAQTVKNLPAMQEPWVQSLFGKIAWSRAWQFAPVFLPGESPWTEEPGGLQSIGLQRVGHN